MNLLENKKTNWGYILVIGVLAVLVGIGTLSWQYWWPLTPDTVNGIEIIKWKTFTNTELGFSFKYPAEWGEVEERIWDSSAGKGYTLKFADIDSCAVGPVDSACATGRSKDFVAERGKWPTDYAGDPDKSKQISVSTCPKECAIPNFAKIDFNLPGKEISGVRLFIPILSKNDAEKFTKECASESLEQKKEICGHYHCQYDIEENINEYLRDLEREELDSISQKRIYIFKEILASSKVL